MRIKKVEILRENLELTRPYTIAYRTISSVENVFLILHLEDGTIGIGCAAPSSGVTGETVEDSVRALREVGEPILHGAAIECFPALLKQLSTEMVDRPAALAAVDVALHDAFCRWQNIRLVDWYGGVHHRMLTSITIGIGTVEKLWNRPVNTWPMGFK